MTAEDLTAQLNGEHASEALSALCALAKTKQGRSDTERLLGDRAILSALAESEQPKVRKNLYRLIGALQNERDLPILCRALETEETMFAIPSILLSLGKLGAKDVLESYRVPVSESEEMDKHVAEIALAYEKAMQRFETVDTSRIERLARPYAIDCIAPHGFAAQLKDELRVLGFSGRIKGDAVRIETDEIGTVYRANGLVEALLTIASDVPMTPNAIANAVQSCIGTSYRIEVRGYLKDRSGFIERLKTMLDGRNNPSAYDCELRIDSRNDVCDLYWKLWNVKDTRYPWRAGTLPASIHPALAHTLTRYALSFVKAPHPFVFDPFCGSGSLLFAAEVQRNGTKLLGVDKSGTAIGIARENAKAGNSRARFVCRDILRFEAHEGADLIVSNMPFGSRVGSHRDNESLYARFVRRLPNLMRDDGIAVLYTTEGKLLERLVRESPRLLLKEKMRTFSGGLSPWVFVIEKQIVPDRHGKGNGNEFRSADNHNPVS